MRRGVPITNNEEAAIKAPLQAKPHASTVARDGSGVWSYATVWRVAERECIELSADREAQGYKRLSTERLAAVIEARSANPNGTQQEIADAAGVSRATVSRIEHGDCRLDAWTGAASHENWSLLRRGVKGKGKA
jgi:DNA-binding XRE family transcriptional regulator